MVKVTQTGRDCLEQYSWWKNRGLWPVEENNECGRCLIPGTNQELRPKGPQNCGAKYTYIYIYIFAQAQISCCWLYPISHCILIIFPLTSHCCRLVSSINPINYIPMIVAFYPIEFPVSIHKYPQEMRLYWPIKYPIRYPIDIHIIVPWYPQKTGPSQLISPGPGSWGAGASMLVPQWAEAHGPAWHRAT